MSNDSDSSGQYVPLAEAARACGVSLRTVQRWTKTGLGTVDVDGKRHVNLPEALSFAARKRTTAIATTSRPRAVATAGATLAQVLVALEKAQTDAADLAEARVLCCRRMKCPLRKR